MHSRKTLRELNKSTASRKTESESNDVEELSSQSYAATSVDHSRKSHKKGRLSSNQSHKNQKIDDPDDDDDTEDYYSDVKHKKEIANKKKETSGSKDTVEEILSDDVYSDKDENISESKKNKKHRKSKKHHENHSHGSMGDGDSSAKKDSSKSKRKKRHKQDSSEVPITEILKKAQEQQRTKYEEPTPLPELTTDTIYVQGKNNGFSAMKISNSRQSKHSRRSDDSMPMKLSRPIKSAIAFQRLWRSSGFIFQGLLGGVTMLHFIFIKTFFTDSQDFITMYAGLSEVYTSIYSFLIALCLVATFDKFDLAHISTDHLRDIFKHHLKSIIAVPLYIIAFSLHQETLKIDDKLTLLHYNSTNIAYDRIDNSNNTHIEIEPGELIHWQRMTLSKDALAVLGWIFISLSNREDMFTTHLQAMRKYAEGDGVLA